MLRGVVVLTAVSYLSTTKIGIIFIYTNILQKKNLFFCVFLWVRVLLMYIYASERGRLVAFLECWVLGAARPTGGGSWSVPRGGRSSSSGAGRGQLEALGAGSTCAECHKLAQCANVQGWTCANVQSLGRVQVCRCADVQTFAGDVCKCASRRVQMCRDSRTFANLNVCNLTYKLSAQRLTRGVLTKFVKR
jgi:hypothetical protein